MENKLRDSFYTDFTEIKNQLQVRKDNPELLARVVDYLGDDFPFFLKPNEQKGIFIRSIHTPNREHLFVRDVIKEFGIETVFCNYSSGKLVMRNTEKYNLVKLAFAEKTNSKGELIFSRKSIVDAARNEGKNLNEIDVVPGISLVDFHNDLVCESRGICDSVDISEWFNGVRNNEDGYYAKLLALFICNGVLFDNYLLGDKSENDFFMKKVWPSFQFIEKKFGLKPLIFPALPIKEENNELYLFYNPEIKNIIKTKYDI